MPLLLMPLQMQGAFHSGLPPAPPPSAYSPGAPYFSGQAAGGGCRALVSGWCKMCCKGKGGGKPAVPLPSNADSPALTPPTPQQQCLRPRPQCLLQQRRRQAAAACLGGRRMVGGGPR
jgi:hypothetical protein